jgi:hypothetical protein
VQGMTNLREIASRPHDQERFAPEPRRERGLRFKIVFAPSISGRTAVSG